MTTNKFKTLVFATIIAAVLVTGTFAATVDAEKIDKFRNYEAEEIMKQLAPYLIHEDGVQKSFSAVDGKEKQKLQKSLKVAQDKHKAKFSNKELMFDLKRGHEIISESNIPTLILGWSNEKLIIQMDPENKKYEKKIKKLLKGIPYDLEYGEGAKRGACSSTTSDCNPEIGGLKIFVNNPGTANDGHCSLSIPMQKNNIDGFLTAGHCMQGSTAFVYQPTYSSSKYIGYSLASWQEFNHGESCDCAWIKDMSSTPQQNGVFAYSNAYWTISGTDVPALNDQAMLRGYHNNNGNWWQSSTILVEGITITEDGIETTDVMGFVSPFQAGDSGGSVFYNGKYMGIAVATGNYGGTTYTFFIPWDNITSHISGLGL